LLTVARSRASSSRGQISMIILLDETFPLRFYTRLQREEFSAENILLTRSGILRARNL